MSGIVVGVDGSQNSLRALEFAIEEARLRGCGLTAVSAYRVPLPVMAPEAMWISQVDEEEIRRSAEASLAGAVAQARSKAAGVEIEQVTSIGAPSEVLCEASRELICWLSARAVTVGSEVCCSGP